MRRSNSGLVENIYYMWSVWRLYGDACSYCLSYILVLFASAVVVTTTSTVATVGIYCTPVYDSASTLVDFSMFYIFYVIKHLHSPHTYTYLKYLHTYTRYIIEYCMFGSGVDETILIDSHLHQYSK